MWYTASYNKSFNYEYILHMEDINRDAQACVFLVQTNWFPGAGEISTEVHFGENTAMQQKHHWFFSLPNRPRAYLGQYPSTERKNSQKDFMEIHWDPSDLTLPGKNMCLRKQAANTEVQSDLYAKSSEKIW